MASAGVPLQIEEDDDELFEINLEAVNAIPPPHYSDTYSFFTATADAALLANCLLPISEVSNAVPMTATGERELFPFAWRIGSNPTLVEQTRLEKLLQLPAPQGFSSSIRALMDRSEMKIIRG